MEADWAAHIKSKGSEGSEMRRNQPRCFGGAAQGGQESTPMATAKFGVQHQEDRSQLTRWPQAEGSMMTHGRPNKRLS